MTVDDMIEGKYGEDIRPDINSMNAMLEVISWNASKMKAAKAA